MNTQKFPPCPYCGSTEMRTGFQTYEATVKKQRGSMMGGSALQHLFCGRCGIPWATLSDIWTGKTRLERCSGGTLVKLSGTLGITVEELIALDVETSMPPDDLKAEKPYFEVNLPQDLEKALREYIQGEQEHSRYLDCLWGELYGSINANQWGGVISKEQADYLRAKYLFEEDDEV